MIFMGKSMVSFYGFPKKNNPLKKKPQPQSAYDLILIDWVNIPITLWYTNIALENGHL